MELVSPDNIKGDQVRLVATHKKHFGFRKVKERAKDKSTVVNFGQLLLNKMDEVNSAQLKADDLTTKLAVSPDKVNIHEVMIAAQKAELALQFTKSIRDRVITAYRELIGMR